MYKNQATEDQQLNIIAHFINDLALATGVEPTGQLTKQNLDDIIFVSELTKAERIARRVQSRARNKSILVCVKRQILNTQLVSSVGCRSSKRHGL